MGRTLPTLVSLLALVGASCPSVVRAYASPDRQQPDSSPAGGAPTRTAKPWMVRKVLNVPQVGGLCTTHPSAHFIASVRGYLEASPLHGPAGGWVGRLFVAPNPHAFYAGDTKPFVEVWGTIHQPFGLNGHRVTVHGLLACDAALYRANLPGWQGSLRPTRITIYAIVCRCATTQRCGARSALREAQQLRYSRRRLRVSNGKRVLLPCADGFCF